MATLTLTEKVYAIPRRDIEPDPNQPRKTFPAADTNALAKSLEADGQQDPCRVRKHPTKPGKYMLIDGERRWRAAEEAGLKTLDCLLETEDIDPADLLILQAQLNSGKPLTPIEEARVCHTLANAPYNLKQTEIADRLGLPRTTVGDRIRMMELPKVWLNAIESGKLTTSHAAVLQPYTAIPAKHHAELFNNVFEHYDVSTAIEENRTPTLEELEDALYAEASDYLHPLTGNEVGFKPADYTGPVLTRKRQYGGTSEERLAADPALWTPLVEAGKKEREKKRRVERAKETTPAKAAAAERPLIRVPDAVERKRASTGTQYATQIPQGNIAIYGAGDVHPDKGWYFGGGGNGYLAAAFDPDTLMARLDPEKCTLFEGESYGGKRFAWLATRDQAALKVAREAAQQTWVEREKEIVRTLGAKPTKAVANDGFDITGSGTPKLIGRLTEKQEYNTPSPFLFNLYWMARATGLEMPPMRRDQSNNVAATPLQAALANLNTLDASRLLSFWLAYDEKKDVEAWINDKATAFLTELRETKYAWTGGTTETEAEVERPVTTEKKGTRVERTRATTGRVKKRETRVTAGAELIHELHTGEEVED